MTTFNLADLFEPPSTPTVTGEYLVAAGHRRTYADMEERATPGPLSGRPGCRAR